jgi:hypothetical protein
MNKLVKKIKTKIKEHNYDKYIERHRENVEKAAWYMIEECKELNTFFMDEELCYQFLQAISKHDLSKYSLEEYDAYRKFYHPIDDEERNSAQEDYMAAWAHHLAHNNHHWQTRSDKKDFDPNKLEDIVPLLENIADWLAMGYEFNDRPYQYYEKNRDKIILHPKEKALLEKIIYEVFEGMEVPKSIATVETGVTEDSIKRG